MHFLHYSLPDSIHIRSSDPQDMDQHGLLPLQEEKGPKGRSHLGGRAEGASSHQKKEHNSDPKLGFGLLH